MFGQDAAGGGWGGDCEEDGVKEKTVYSIKQSAMGRLAEQENCMDIAHAPDTAVAWLQGKMAGGRIL